MVMPGFMWRGVYEQKALGSTTTNFWGYLTEEMMIKNFFDVSKVADGMEALIIRKILDVTSKGEDVHAYMRKLFPLHLVFPKALQFDAVGQTESVQFAVHFEKGSGPSRMEACKKHNPQ